MESINTFNYGNEIHALMERHINEIINEYSKAEEGYKLIIKARLYDLQVY